MFCWIKNHPVISLTSLYALIRVVSFFSWGIAWAQGVVVISILVIFLYFCATNIATARDILIGELLLDGAGHFFEFQSLILRTWLLGIFAMAWLAHKCVHRDFKWPRKNILVAMTLFEVALLLSIVIGLTNHHSPMLVAQDAMLYLFLLLVFPALDISNINREIYKNIIKAFIWGSGISSIITFFLYSSEIFILNNSFYRWFRNVASGKITDLGEGFFRIVLPEHILLVPIIIILSALLMRNIRYRNYWILLTVAMAALSLNFTRIYFLSIGVGLIFLLIKNNWKHWCLVSGSVIAGIFILFCFLNLIASRGHSLGLDLLGFKLSGIRTMSSDPSGAIRLALLPDILKTIKKNPLMGTGFGTTVTYIDPASGVRMTRSQFDWGYLEMIAELGIIGSIIYLLLLGVILYNLFVASRVDDSIQIMRIGSLAGALSLCVINITTPALFQGFGVIYFVFLITTSNDVFVRSLPAPARSL